MANTAITSNRAVPGNNMALEYEKCTQNWKENAKPLIYNNRKSATHDSIFHRPFTLYIFFFFYPWTALLCYNCISYEGSVSGTGSGPHGGKDCSSKSLTGTIGDGAGDCLLSVFISILDFYALTRIVQFELIYLPKSSAHRSRMFLHNECHTHLLRFISGCKSFTLQELTCVF